MNLQTSRHPLNLYKRRENLRVMRRELAFLIVIVLIGGILRIVDLGTESLWNDEILSVDHASQPTAADVVEHVKNREAAPPGHYLVLHYWILLFGDADFSVRLLSVLFSVASIVLLYIVTRLYFSERTALIAALLFATSMSQVLYAQEARLYSMFTFLVLMTTYFFFRGFMVRTHILHRVLYVVALIAALYTNYLAGVVIVFYGFLLLWNRRATLRWMMLTACALLLSAPLAFIVADQFARANGGLSEVLLSYGVPQAIAGLGLFVFAMPSMLVCALLCGILLLRKHFARLPQLPPRIFIFLAVVFCATYGYLAIYPLSIVRIPVFRVPITNSYFLIRHSLFLAPLLYVLAAWKINSLDRKTVAVVLGMILVTQAFSLGVFYTTITKPDWKGSMAFVERQSGYEMHPLMLLDRGGGSNTLLLERYYSDADVVDLTLYSSRSEFYQIPDDILIEKVRGRSFWLVLSKNHGTGDYYKDLLDKNFERSFSGEIYGVNVYQYRSLTIDNLKYAGSS